MATIGRGTFLHRKNLWNNGAVQHTKWAVSQVVISLSLKLFGYGLATHLLGLQKGSCFGSLGEVKPALVMMDSA